MQFKHVHTSKDIEQVAALAHSIWMEHYPPILPEGQTEYMLEKYQSAITITKQIKEGHQYYFMIDNDSTIGYLDYYMKREECFISKVYVSKSNRGKGHGNAALKFIEEKARQLNAMRLGLTVNKNNTIAIEAYQRAGFVNAGAIQIDISDGYIMDDYKFEKSL